MINSGDITRDMSENCGVTQSSNHHDYYSKNFLILTMLSVLCVKWIYVDIKNISTALWIFMTFDNIQFLRVGGHIAEADCGETGAGEVEGGDVGLHVSDTPAVRVVVLSGQNRHPTSDKQKMEEN